MPANKDSGNQISAQAAKELITNFRKDATVYRDQDPARGIKGGFYGGNRILSILNQPGCVGLRYFFGLNASNQLVIVLSGEDADGNVLEGVLVNEGPLCPPICGKTSTLDP